jgi:hypothetical protein
MAEHEPRNGEPSDRSGAGWSGQAWAERQENSEILDTDLLRREDPEIPRDSGDDAAAWHERIDPVVRDGRDRQVDRVPRPRPQGRARERSGGRQRAR